MDANDGPIRAKVDHRVMERAMILGTLLAELMADAAKKFTSSIHGLDDLVSVGLQHNGVTSRSWERSGCRWHRTGLFSEP